MRPPKVSNAADRFLRLTGAQGKPANQGSSSDNPPTKMPPTLDTVPTMPISSLDGMDKILDNLYLGNLQSAQDPELLQQNGITHILSLLSPRTPFHLPPPLDNVITRQLVELTDEAETNILVFITSCLDFLETTLSASSNNKVLVHCRAGISRSASVVIAFLMKHENISFDDALETVRNARPRVHPNRGFRSQLELLESISFDMSVLGEMDVSVANIYDETEGNWGKRKRRKVGFEMGMGRVRLQEYDQMLLWEVLKELEVTGRIKAKVPPEEVRKPEEPDKSAEATNEPKDHKPKETMDLDAKPDENVKPEG